MGIEELLVGACIYTKDISVTYRTRRKLLRL